MKKVGSKPKLKKGAGNEPPQKPLGFAPPLEVMLPEELKIGDDYYSWICDGCTKLLALHMVTAGYNPEPIPHTVVMIKCPHCRAERRYSVNEAQVRQYTG
jgi:hypothetical protein